MTVLALAVLVVVRVLGVERGSVLALLLGALPLTLLPAYGVLAVALRRRLLAAGAAVLVVAHLLVVAPALGAEDVPAAAASAPRLRVVTANLYVLNPDVVAAGRALRALLSRFPLRDVTTRSSAGEAEQVDLPLVVAGDLNADRDHALFRGLLDTGLRDAHDSVGRGLTRTWPASLPLLHLDHVLVRDGDGAQLAVLAVDEVTVPGSDHRAVVADLAVLAA